MGNAQDSSFGRESHIVKADSGWTFMQYNKGKADVDSICYYELNSIENSGLFSYKKNKEDSLYGVIDAGHQVYFKQEFDTVFSFSNQGFVVVKDSELYLITSDMVFDLNYKVDFGPFKSIEKLDDFIKVKTEKGYGLYNYQKEILLKDKFETIGKWYGGYLTIKNNKLGFFREEEGRLKQILTNKFEHILPVFNHAMLKAKINNKWHYYKSSNGEELNYNPTTDSLALLQYGFYKVYKGKAVMLYKTQNNRLIASSNRFEYFPLNDNYLVRVDGDSVGLQELNGNVLFHPKYHKIIVPAKSQKDLIFEYKGKQGVCNYKGDTIIDPIYTRVLYDQTYEGIDYYKIVSHKKVGLANNLGEIIIKPSFRIIEFKGNYVVTSNGKKYGIFDMQKRRQVLDTKYLDIDLFNGTDFKAFLNGKYTIANLDTIFFEGCNKAHSYNQVYKCYKNNGIYVADYDSGKINSYFYDNVPSYPIVDTSDRRDSRIHIRSIYDLYYVFDHARGRMINKSTYSGKDYNTNTYKGYPFLSSNSNYLVRTEVNKEYTQEIFNTEWNVDHVNKIFHNVGRGDVSNYMVSEEFPGSIYGEKSGLNYTITIVTKKELNSSNQDYILHFTQKNEKPMFVDWFYDHKRKFLVNGQLSLSTKKSPFKFSDYYLRLNPDAAFYPKGIEMYKTLLNDSLYVQLEGGSWKVASTNKTNRIPVFFKAQKEFDYIDVKGNFSEMIYGEHGKYGVYSDSNFVQTSANYDTLIRYNVSNKFIASKPSYKYELINTLTNKKHRYDNVISFKYGKITSYNNSVFNLYSTSNSLIYSDSNYFKLLNNESIIIEDNDTLILYNLNSKSKMVFPGKNLKIINESLFAGTVKSNLFLYNKNGDNLNKTGGDKLRFLGDYIAIVTSNKTKVFNSKGVFIKLFSTRNVEHLNNEFIEVNENGGTYIYDLNKKVNITPKKTKLINNSNKLALYQKGKNYYLVDFKGKEIEMIKSKSKPIYSIIENYYTIKEGDNWYFVKPSGARNIIDDKEVWLNGNSIEGVVNDEIVVLASIDNKKQLKSEGYSVYRNGNRSSFFFNNKLLLKDKYHIENYNEFALVQFDPIYGFIDYLGKEIIPFKYDEMTKDGYLFKTRVENEIIYLNFKGEEVYRYKL